MNAHLSLEDAGWRFDGGQSTDGGSTSHVGDLHDGGDLTGVGPALAALIRSLGTQPRLLGLGEPMHGEEEFLRLRNQAFQHLVEHQGYRSIALESDCLAGVEVDVFVEAGAGELEDVMEYGFSHGFGELAANRELVSWMREYNADHLPEDRLRFYGFDAPIEMTSAQSPRTPLLAVYEYLANQSAVGRDPFTRDLIEDLVGEDERWTNPAAIMDAAQSIGASLEVSRLRLIADDLLVILAAESPRLIQSSSPDDWWRAVLNARTAAGLLRYHAETADADPSRVARLMALRDVMMAENLKAVSDHEAERGPTLVFAHNRHLQKNLSTWQLGEMSLEWWSAGAIAAAQSGRRYAFIAGALGSASQHDIPAPEEGTLEEELGRLPGGKYVLDARKLSTALGNTVMDLTLRMDAPEDTGYFPLEPDQLDGTDGVLFLKEIS
ncbi:erythromycin esterase family protein [Arthrobacter sp. ISL-30]|uniref:erythromycin esterase family protein n=1 Tax=Arthrobacter sp. ISL-30 TaxID=2819109 RepID=UPI001BEC2BD7|nr:erythromycin esterase family protein [Arthrobacter sp. ISL-30]MBT2513361.1 erythromycin esterase family protein [Arthrobacter sp. ISL-30]